MFSQIMESNSVLQEVGHLPRSSSDYKGGVSTTTSHKREYYIVLDSEVWRVPSKAAGDSE